MLDRSRSVVVTNLNTFGQQQNKRKKEKKKKQKQKQKKKKRKKAQKFLIRFNRGSIFSR